LYAASEGRDCEDVREEMWLLLVCDLLCLPQTDGAGTNMVMSLLAIHDV
jgi:hypothetical protein